jgi:hypothetical protein
LSSSTGRHWVPIGWVGRQPRAAKPFCNRRRWPSRTAELLVGWSVSSIGPGTTNHPPPRIGRPQADGNPSTTTSRRRPHPRGGQPWLGWRFGSLVLARLGLGDGSVRRSVRRRRVLSPCDLRVRGRDAARWSRRDRYRAPGRPLMARFVVHYTAVTVCWHDSRCDQRVRDGCDSGSVDCAVRRCPPTSVGVDEHSNGSLWLDVIHAPMGIHRHRAELDGNPSTSRSRRDLDPPGDTAVARVAVRFARSRPATRRRWLGSSVGYR